MTSTVEPVVVPVTDVNPPPPPRCQVQWQCPDKCLPPTRCPDRAQYRVTFRCASPACDHASDLVLMCTKCTEHADTLGPVLARRPL